MKTVLSVVGARPQFIKAAPLTRRIRARFTEVLVHTGQHYDPRLSDRFFSELDIPAPDVNLGVGSAGHAEQTARMRRGLVRVGREAGPDVLLVYGDTNSTLAAALAAAELSVPLAHVEAGLRSFSPSMPEEVNRIAADHLADLCLCPTETAMEQLRSEGIGDRARLVGDVMLDGCLEARERARIGLLDELGLAPRRYHLATVHRAENTDAPDRLFGILEGLGKLSLPVVVPVHPRTSRAMAKLNARWPENVRAVEPVSYLENIALVSNATSVITDSGGLQKEAYFLGVRCVTLRDETEWRETVDAGWNVLTQVKPDAIVDAVERQQAPVAPPDLDLFGGGKACDRVVDALAEAL